MKTLRISDIDNNLPKWTAMIQVIDAMRIQNTYGILVAETYRRFVFADSQIITSTTVIEEVNELEVPNLPFFFSLCSFTSMHRLAETDNFINVLGVIIHALPLQQLEVDEEPSIARDYFIVNQEKSPMIVTLWNEFEDNEGAIISENLSLSTQPISVIIVHPRVQEAIQLDDWFHDNFAELAQMIYSGAYNDPKALLRPAIDMEIKKIIEIQTTRINSNLIHHIATTLHQKMILCFVKNYHDHVNFSRNARHSIVTAYISNDVSDAESSTSRTIIEEVNEEEDPNLPSDFQLYPFGELHKEAYSSNLINLSLSMQESSIIMVNPVIQETKQLKHWYHSNIAELTQMVVEKNVSNPSMLLPPVNNNETTPIVTLLEDPTSV
ncbi:hypothetical protein ACH5RR_006327 [Cinchona calisaya]|uniref:Replication protein A OB domain-containing protein n=1 Tax=Cinchona calisaya TaxID=153742 RepID=A0ABD3AP02_9GENT